MNKEKVSVIIPVYNVEKEIARCVESLLAQTYSSIEIILIDDGSTDNSSKLCDDYSAGYANIVVLHKENGGLSDARNTGLRHAKGKYILYVDSDDYIEKDSCKRLVECIQKTETDFVVGNIREVRKKNITHQKHSNIIPNIPYMAKDFIIKSIKANEWHAPAVLNLYNKDFLLENSLFFKDGRLYEDIEILPRVYLAATQIAYLDYDFYNYIIREDSITTSKINRKKIQDAVNNYVFWKQLFDTVEDEELRTVLFGALIKHYLNIKRRFGIKGWVVPGVNIKFALKYALNAKERLKVILLGFF